MCDKNCLNCDFTNEGECNSCMNGYFLINDKCKTKKWKNVIYVKMNQENNIIKNKDFKKINNKIKYDKNKKEPYLVYNIIFINIKQIAFICIFVQIFQVNYLNFLVDIQ